MPRPGDIDTTYPDKLKVLNIELLEPFKGAKQHHKMRCLQCKHEWDATPLSKLQNYKLYGRGGCPLCTRSHLTDRKSKKRQLNLQTLKARGLEVLSNWDGRYVQGIPGQSIPVMVTVRNTKCGHTFTSSSKNLLTRGVECPTCAKMYLTNILNDNAERIHTKWAQTATQWQLYKSTVTSLTRKAYKTNKKKINPDNLPQGRAGTKGAYHLDHIVPIRYCFENNIPAKLCSHRDNLQMLRWLDNVSSRDNPKGKIPSIFEGWINIVNGEHA